MPRLRLAITLRHVSLGSPVLCWLLDAGKKEAPHAELTGVQKPAQSASLTAVHHYVLRWTSENAICTRLPRPS
jgi:hypothetical protein